MPQLFSSKPSTPILTESPILIRHHGPSEPYIARPSLAQCGSRRRMPQRNDSLGPAITNPLPIRHRTRSGRHRLPQRAHRRQACGCQPPTFSTFPTASECPRRIGILRKSFPTRTCLAQTATGKRNALLGPEKDHQTASSSIDEFQSDLDSTGTFDRVRNDRLLRTKRPAMLEVAGEDFRARRTPVMSYFATNTRRRPTRT
jgi:hypothetical protein